MSGPDALRRKAERCRQLAGMTGDEEIERQLNALADEYDAKAMQAHAKDSNGPRQV
ncbi:MAG TPA: hypothetical protein VGM62_07770 [Chthoniobacterales bacterium]